MPHENIEIQKLALFSCKKDQDPAVIDRKEFFKTEEIESINEDLKSIFRDNTMGKGRFRGVWNSVPGKKNTRVHDFENKSALEIFKALLDDNQNFDDKSTDLIERYLGTKKSQTAVIFVFKIQIPPNPYIMIYSSEYLGGVLSFSDEEIIEEIKNVFSKGLIKGLLYPYQADDKLHFDKAKVYQKRGPYAIYWWTSFGLREEPSNEETLAIALNKYEKEQGEKMQFTEKNVGNIIQENKDAANSGVTLECDEIKIHTILNELYGNVIPVTKDDEKMIVIKGEDIFIKIEGYGLIEFESEEGYKKIDEM